MTRKTAVVTGASSRIGEATAQRLAMAGYEVYGTSRRGAQARHRAFEMLRLDVTSESATTFKALLVPARPLDIDFLAH